MARGLSAHADELSPGVLFRRHRAGGCAVGITLRELAPEAFDFGFAEFWLWQRWRRGVERDVAAGYPRLKHLQWYFDEAVRAASPELSGRTAAREVGLWFAASAEEELWARESAHPSQAGGHGVLPLATWNKGRRGHEIRSLRPSGARRTSAWSS
jgi:hypothetical protein